MKKIFILGLTAIFLSVIFTYFMEAQELEHVIDVTLDSDGMINILQKESSEDIAESFVNYFKNTYSLVKIDETGTILKEYNLPASEATTFSEYDNLNIDFDGNLYLHRTVQNANDYRVTSDEVLMISSDGSEVKTLSKFAYKPDKDGLLPEYSLINKIYLLDHHLYVIRHSELDYNNIFMERINILNGEASTFKELKLDPNLYIKDFLYLKNEKLIFSTSRGELYTYSDGSVKAISYAGMPSIIHPTNLQVFDENSFAFYDLESNGIALVNTQNETFEFLKNAVDVIDAKKDIFYKDINRIYIRDNQAITGKIRINLEGNRYVFVDSQDKKIIIEDISYSNKDLAKKFGKNLFLYGFAALFIWFLIVFYEKSGGSLIIKFSSVLLPLVIIIPLITLSVSFSYFNNLAKTDLYSELFNIAKERATKISADHLNSIESINDYAGTEYQLLSKQRKINADEFNSSGQNTYKRWYYSVIYKYDGDKIHFVTGDDIEYWATTDYIYGEKSNQSYERAVKENKVMLGENSDPSGEWVFAVAPIRNSKGEVIGLFEVGTGKESYSYFIQAYYGRLVTMNLLIVGMVIILMAIVIYRVILPLKYLNDSVADISQGNWGSTVAVRTKDEIGQLSILFNKMSLFIKDYVNELTVMNNMYYKFIPQKFFELLNKKTISEVKLGDYSKQKMTILYINASDYFDYVKGKSSKEQLIILNGIFEEYSKLIHINGGLVGEFRNAGVLALFTNEADALATASMVMQRVNEIDILKNTNISIHHGEVLLGIIGDDNRMNTAVISECVNEVIAINRIAGKYGCGVLMSEEIKTVLDGENKNLRYIGSIINEMSERKISIYEWIETIEVNLQKDYLKSLDAFNEALEHYENNDYQMAKKSFIITVKANPKDLVSKEYLFKCEQLISNEFMEEKSLETF